jgi:glucose/arabinose dehydrogenase
VNAGDMLVGLHGSWNSTQRVGYGVARILFDDQTKQPIGMMRLVTTEVGGKVMARPVDVVQEPDGGILFSDDSGNKIYRITAAQ